MLHRLVNAQQQIQASLFVSSLRALGPIVWDCANPDKLFPLGFERDLDQSKSPRVRLQRLEKCLDQKLAMVRQQSTGSTA